MNLGVRHALSRPLLCYCKAMGATLRGLGTGLQGGQGRMGAARGRTTRRTRHPPAGEQDLTSCDASAAPRRPGGVCGQSDDAS